MLATAIVPTGIFIFAILLVALLVLARGIGGLVRAAVRARSPQGMKKVRVRVWVIQRPRKSGGEIDELLITYPEGNLGYELVACLNCGQLYAASVTAQVYGGPPLLEKLKGMSCIKCQANLSETYALYPEKYRTPEGDVLEMERSMEIPDDKDSQIVSLPAIYDE